MIPLEELLIQSCIDSSKQLGQLKISYFVLNIREINILNFFSQYGIIVSRTTSYLHYEY